MTDPDDAISEIVSSSHAGKDTKPAHGKGGADAIALAKAKFTKETVWKCKEAINIAAGSNMEVNDTIMFYSSSLNILSGLSGKRKGLDIQGHAG